MKTHFITYGVVGASVLGVVSLLLLSVPAAQNSGPAANLAAIPTPRALDGHPSLEGFWVSRVAGIPTYHEEVPSEILTQRAQDGSIFFNYGGAAGAGRAPEPGQQEQQPRRESSAPKYTPKYAAKVKAIN